MARAEALTVATRVAPFAEAVISCIAPPYFPEIPPNARPNEKYLGVAAHELNHAFVAILSGATIARLSIHPSSDGSLGRTILAGNLIETKSFQIIATAGSLPTVFGNAEGFGSDVHTATILSYYGGIPVESARSSAADLLRQIPTDVQKRTAELVTIIGANGDISHSTLLKILARAYWDVAMQKTVNGEYNIAQTYKNKADSYYKQSQEYQLQHPEKVDLERNEDITVISVHPGGKMEIAYIDKNGKEHKLCKKCGQLGKHTVDCQAATTKPIHTSLRRNNYTV